jgi:hypothetical protein
MGLEFYPLGGDPEKLSEFMVRTHGCLIPSFSDLVHEIPKNIAMLTEIIHSCWGACVGVDIKNAYDSSFIADAIISNPVTYGHIHCAEALGIPLHLMFPQVRTLPNKVMLIDFFLSRGCLLKRFHIHCLVWATRMVGLQKTTCHIR